MAANLRIIREFRSSYPCEFTTTNHNILHVSFLVRPIDDNFNINVNYDEDYLNARNFEKMINDYNSSNKYITAKIIFENIINNFKLYMRLWKQHTDYVSYDLVSKCNDSNSGYILYIDSIDELLNIRKSDELFLCYLNDILIKLKLSMDIIITDIVENVVGFMGKRHYGPLLNDETKYIKIGYIDDKSKPYNENLKIYKDEKDRLIYLISNTLLKNNTKTCEFSHEMKEKIYNIFTDL